MKVAALQTDIIWEDPAANFEAVAPRLRAAAEDGARLLLLPEMFGCGFSMNTASIAEAPDGPSTAFLHDTARDLGVWIGGSIPVREVGADKPHNTFVLAGPGGEDHRYQKVHPFTYDGEHEHYAAGDELVTWTIEGVRWTPFICYDLRFADEFWQRANDTDGYLVVANWPAPRREHWRVLLRARAIENQAYVVGLNRVGESGGERPGRYRGDSQVVDPWGTVLVEAADEPTTLMAEIDPARVAEARKRFPVLGDRRAQSARLR